MEHVKCKKDNQGLFLIYAGKQKSHISWKEILMQKILLSKHLQGIKFDFLSQTCVHLGEVVL